MQDTNFIQIFFEQLEIHDLQDQKQKLFNLLEGGLFGGAMQKSRNEIDALWVECQDLIALKNMPPNEDELLLKNPTMSV
tara:strand:+ start:122 stop:358 length:237 start_codon:yes stop_codon:yes gene_type:complete